MTHGAQALQHQALQKALAVQHGFADGPDSDLAASVSSDESGKALLGYKSTLKSLRMGKCASHHSAHTGLCCPLPSTSPCRRSGTVHAHACTVD